MIVLDASVLVELLLGTAAAAVALEDLRFLDLQRHAHEPLLDRIWELRQNLGAYNAVYMALAEVLDTVLLTCDGRLARAPGAERRVSSSSPRPELRAPGGRPDFRRGLTGSPACRQPRSPSL